MATMIAVYFLAIILAIALGGICDRLDNITAQLRKMEEWWRTNG